MGDPKIQRGGPRPAGWEPFERLAARYDAWFDQARGRRLFDLESDCLRDLLVETPRPRLEVGVGTGRFAATLDMDEGVDPSPAVLEHAAARGVRVQLGRAEALPFPDGRFGVVLLVVTLCFVDDPVQTLRECRRVLRPDGYVVVGLVPRDSAWGEAYAQQGAAGHPFYSVARFYTAREAIAWAGQAGLYLDRASSCVFEAPGQPVSAHHRPREGLLPQAGFVGLRFRMGPADDPP